MAEITKPSGLNKIWAATGTISTPSDLKISTGNIVEKPAYDYFNFWQNRVDTFNAFMNQHGFPTWDADTEYQAEKSYVMHSNGTVYRCISTHTNQAIPNATYWEIAFSDYGSSYTKAEANALYLAKASNLSDLNNPVTARTNLSVYSKSQIDTAIAQATTSSLGRVVLATTAEVQTGTDADKVLTPQTFANSVLGVNQTWQDVTASRAILTNYTNTTGRPIMVSVMSIETNTGGSYVNRIRIRVDGVAVFDDYKAPGSQESHSNAIAIVPPGSTYSVPLATNLSRWMELR